MESKASLRVSEKERRGRSDACHGTGWKPVMVLLRNICQNWKQMGGTVGLLRCKALYREYLVQISDLHVILELVPFGKQRHVVSKPRALHKHEWMSYVVFLTFLHLIPSLIWRRCVIMICP